MIVTCPNCEARYAVDPLAIGPSGRTVQCARCDNRWFQKVEGPRPAPDLVIRPPTRGASLPAVIEPKAKLQWRRYAPIAGVAAGVIVVAAALFYFRHDIGNLISSVASTTSQPAKAPAPAAAAAAPKPAPDIPHLEIDLSASKVELVEGRYVVHGEIVNGGRAPGWTKSLKFTFKKGNDVVGEKSYPQKLGPIAPGARLAFSQTLDDPPAGTTDIVPTVE